LLSQNPAKQARKKLKEQAKALRLARLDNSRNQRMEWRPKSSPAPFMVDADGNAIGPTNYMVMQLS
jgi:hypothetical protein